MSDVFKNITLCVFLLAGTTLFAQEKAGLPPPDIKGYLKYLSNNTSLNLPFYQELLTNQLVHHRLNLRWDLGSKMVFRAGWRNQMFFGELVKTNPDFADQLKRGQKDYFDWSWNVVRSSSMFINSTVDRFYIEYYAGNLEISLGRQRVNWGINTIWNPNDIFNTFSFIDFDYEERPGSDAVLFKYYLGNIGSIEAAAKFHGKKENTVVAGLWKFNTREYDIQILGGYANGYWTIGNGWAGNLGNAGWKGEWTWFVSDLEGVDNTFLVTTAVDYSFTSGWYINGGYLYNHSGSGGASISELLTFAVSAQNIYPYRHAILLTNSYPVSPLINLAVSVVYTPNRNHPTFINPVVAYSVAQNWDLDLTGQIGLEKGDTYYSPIQAIYLRLKWSY